MEKERILIIKLGAMGDVLRTTSLLRVLEGDIYWITRPNAIPLLENNEKITLLTDNLDKIKGTKFDLVLNLDDDIESCKMLEELDYNKLEGYYLKEGKILATKSAYDWWAMGYHGLPEKDDLKKANTRPMQEYLFRIAGKEFKGENYILHAPPHHPDPKLIGIEENCGKVWPMKRWDKYRQLGAKLEGMGYRVRFFAHRESLNDYIKDIAECSQVITGDTLTMHIALALKKPVTAIFGPTSAHEIYDYGLLTKVVTPLGCHCCYRRTCDKKPNCMENIKVETILSTIKI